MNQRKFSIKTALICGMLGCICFGAGDWLIMYGSIQHTGEVYWLTEGVANIPLRTMQDFILKSKIKKSYILLIGR